jgi:hypothetical protein
MKGIDFRIPFHRHVEEEEERGGGKRNELKFRYL